VKLAPDNPFVAPETARAYAQGRPYFHPLVIEKVRETLELRAPVGLAVDVAYGTGLSSSALLALADWVVATDISEEMLSQAPTNERIRYELAPAESLPLEDASADLVTVSSAFHWFERRAFLQEARRVLRQEGGLVIYENFFEGRRHPNPDFVRWLKDYYEAHPAPPRDQTPFTDDDAQNAGFDFVARLTYENTWSFPLSGFVAYLLSQSNAVAAVARGRSTVEALRLRLAGQLRPVFGRGNETFPFAGFIWILRRP
jgi:SAM-dependent methyltransferase